MENAVDDIVIEKILHRNGLYENRRTLRKEYETWLGRL